MLPKLPLAHRAMMAELLQGCMEARFDEQFPDAGRFYKATVKGRSYWYFVPSGSSPQRVYVGPADDPDITERVERFREIKAAAKERRMLVRSLLAAGLPRPSPQVGDVVEALGRNGLFQQGGVLVGPPAFPCYSAYLGVRLPTAAVRTGHVHPARAPAVSMAVEGSLSRMIETLRTVDLSFQPIPEIGPRGRSVRVRNEQGFEVEFLIANRGGKPEPGLDFLVREPVRSVMLHQTGVPVTIPAPERYAVRGLIRVGMRGDDGQQEARTDLAQPGILITALHQEQRLSDIGEVFLEAWDRGARWREALVAGCRRLDTPSRKLLDHAVEEARRAAGREMITGSIY